MARRKTPPIDPDLFTETDHRPTIDLKTGVVDLPAEGPTTQISVGLRASELAVFDGLCQEHKLARNALARFAIRYFLKAHLRGEIDLAPFVKPPENFTNDLDMF